MISHCPACLSETVAKCADIYDLPLILFPVDPGEDVPRKRLVVYRCHGCGHMCTPTPSLDVRRAIYEDLYRYYPFVGLEAMKSEYREPAEECIGQAIMRRSGRPPTLLEIGCSDSSQVQHAVDQGADCTILGPGAKPSVEVKAVNCYYGERSLDSRFDIISSRFCLEHVSDLDAFFVSASHNLTNSGSLFIQVPNVAAWEADDHVSIPFAHEHVHYFTRQSLLQLAQRHQFLPTIVSEPGAPSLFGLFTRTSITGSGSRDVRSQLERLRHVARALNMDHPGDITLYGAGLSAVYLVNCDELTLSTKARLTIVDDNPAVLGRVLPGHNTVIRAATTDILQRAAVVLVTANPQYHASIESRIKSLAPQAHVSTLSRLAVRGKELPEP